jgi:hypothetical protein
MKNVNTRSKPITSPKPASAISRKAVKAPQAYRLQPTPKCLQLKAAPEPVIDQAGVNKPSAKSPTVYRPQPVPKVLQRKTVSVGPSPPASLRQSIGPSAYRPRHGAAQLRSSGVVQRAEAVPVSRKDKQAEQMIWNEFTPVSMPAAKHILEDMKLNDANGDKKVSVVKKKVAQDAVAAIGAHVKAHGWHSSDTITIEWVQKDRCYKVTFAGNEWMTHVGSGQIWPFHGPDIFSPPERENVKSYITKWRGGQTPAKHMNA